MLCQVCHGRQRLWASHTCWLTLTRKKKTCFKNTVVMRLLWRDQTAFLRIGRLRSHLLGATVVASKVWVTSTPATTPTLEAPTLEAPTLEAPTLEALIAAVVVILMQILDTVALKRLSLPAILSLETIHLFTLALVGAA